jgi:hypothetical protein
MRRLSIVDTATMAARCRRARRCSLCTMPAREMHAPLSHKGQVHTTSLRCCRQSQWNLLSGHRFTPPVCEPSPPLPFCCAARSPPGRCWASAEPLLLQGLLPSLCATSVFLLPGRRHMSTQLTQLVHLAHSCCPSSFRGTLHASLRLSSNIATWPSAFLHKPPSHAACTNAPATALLFTNHDLLSLARAQCIAPAILCCSSTPATATYMRDVPSHARKPNCSGG